MTCGQSSTAASPRRRRPSAVLLAAAWRHGVAGRGPRCPAGHHLLGSAEPDLHQRRPGLPGADVGRPEPQLLRRHQRGVVRHIPRRQREPVRARRGPAVADGLHARVTQTFSGGGTAASPFVVTTIVDAVPRGHQAAGRPHHRDRLLRRRPALLRHGDHRGRPRTIAGTLYHAGDCFLSNLDSGFGAFDATSGSPGSPMCTINANNSPPARFMSFIPVSPSANFIESQFNTVWSDITNAAPPFPNTVDASTNQDNGMGLSWPISMAGGRSAQFHLTTTVSPFTPPVSNTSAGRACPTARCRSRCRRPTARPRSNYILDGGVPQSVPTDCRRACDDQRAAGQAHARVLGPGPDRQPGEPPPRADRDGGGGRPQGHHLQVTRRPPATRSVTPRRSRSRPPAPA